MKLKSITVEGMHNVDKKTYHFNDFTYLYGKNGSGKSTVLNAIQLALLGYIPGTNKQTGAIFSHSNNHTMSVTAVLADENEEWSLRRTFTTDGKSVKSTVVVNPEGHTLSIAEEDLPIFDFSVLLDMSANQAKSWFISHMPAVDISVDWFSKLRDSSNEHISDDYINEMLSTLIHSDPISECQQLNQIIKESISVEKQTLKRWENSIAGLAYYEDVDPSMSTEDIQQEIDRLEKLKSDIDKAKIVRSVNSKNAQIVHDYPYKEFSDSSSIPEVCALNSRITKLKEELADCNLNLSQFDDLLEPALRNMYTSQSLLTSAEKAANSVDTCPIMNIKCDSLISMKDKNMKLVMDYQKSFNQHQSEVNRLYEELHELEDDKKQIESEIDIATQNLRALESAFLEYQRAKSAMGEVDTALLALPESFELDDELVDLKRKLVKIEANKQYNNVVEQMISEKYKSQETLNALKSWDTLTGMNGLQSTLSTSQFDKFSEYMNPLLASQFGNEVSAWFNIESKANSFAFGITRNDTHISYDLLSSGEKCMYVVCLLSAIVESKKLPLNLLMFDDIFDHLDQEHLDQLLTTLAKTSTDIQYIVAGTKLYKGSSNISDHLVEVKSA